MPARCTLQSTWKARKSRQSMESCIGRESRPPLWEPYVKSCLNIIRTSTNIYGNLEHRSNKAMLKIWSEGTVVTRCSRPFRTRDAETGNNRSPTVNRRVRRTASENDDDDTKCIEYASKLQTLLLCKRPKSFKAPIIYGLSTRWPHGVRSQAHPITSNQPGIWIRLAHIFDCVRQLTVRM